MSLLHLESRLNKTPKMLATIGQRLEQVGEQALFFQSQQAAGSEPQTELEPHYAHPSVIGNLANLYQETLSTFSFRIQVTGEPRNLKNSDNADKIRALLLAGIRAAILWRQVGGRRWHLLFFRSRVGKSASRILNSRRAH
jgi:high frequency lysogenization protein